MISAKDTNKLIKNILRSLPVIPFVAPRRRPTPLAPLILGAIGLAFVGGIAAVMLFSPRTRYRALDIAKGGYGKVRGQLGQTGLANKLGISRRERVASGVAAAAKDVSEPAGANYQTGL